MVIRGLKRNAGEHGSLTADLLVAVALLVVAAVPMAFTIEQEIRLCRGHYQNALAMEVVDGEMEILSAGEWRAFPPGEHPYPVRAAAVKNLPPGRFVLTRRDPKLRLEWQPMKLHHGRPVVREGRIP